MAVQTQETPLAGVYERRKQRRRTAGFDQGGGADYILLLTVLALVTVGLLMVYSATYTLGYLMYENAHWFILRQAQWAGIGVVAMLLFWRIPYRIWQRWSVLMMGGTIVALIVLLILDRSVFGANRWLLNGSVQPSEAAKLAVVIYIAHWASSKEEKIRKLDAGLIPFAILIGLICGLILLQPNFSTAVLIALTSVAMFFIAGADLKQLLISGLIGSATLALVLTRAAYRVSRLQAFLDPLATQDDVGYQISRVLLALARGGLTGQGLGSSRPIPPAFPAGHTDAIFALLGQELGLVACLLVLGLFLLVAHRGFRIAAMASDGFGTILASGVTCWLVFQAIVNVAVVTNTMPFTGVPLPFISFGGSGLVTALAGIGLLLSVSSARARSSEPRAADAPAAALEGRA